MKGKNENPSGEVRIKGVPKTVKAKLTNIAKHIGIDVSTLLKPKLREVADSYPSYMHEPPKPY